MPALKTIKYKATDTSLISILRGIVENSLTYPKLMI
jgi:hypothetical protein